MVGSGEGRCKKYKSQCCVGVKRWPRGRFHVQSVCILHGSAVIGPSAYKLFKWTPTNRVGLTRPLFHSVFEHWKGQWGARLVIKMKFILFISYCIIYLLSNFKSFNLFPHVLQKFSNLLFNFLLYNKLIGDKTKKKVFLYCYMEFDLFKSYKKLFLFLFNHIWILFIYPILNLSIYFSMKNRNRYWI